MKHSMRIMGRSGDVAVKWDTETPTEVEEARKSFVEKMKSGMLAFEVAPDTKESKQVTKFNPDADMVLVPQISGG